MYDIEILEAAGFELSDVVEYYNSVQTNLGYEFLDEFKRSVQRIIMFPHAWPVFSRRLRRCQTNRFPYGVVYHKQKERLLIVSVMNLHAEPRRWKRILERRLRDR